MKVSNTMMKTLVAVAVLSTAFAVSAEPTGKENGGLMQQMMSQSNKVAATQGQLSNVEIRAAGHGNGGLMQQMTSVKVASPVANQADLSKVYVKDHV
jgi:hypothetical protein